MYEFPKLFKNGTTNRERERTRKREGRVESILLEYKFYGAWALGNPNVPMP
jgi:hypothetical protein